MPQDLPDSKSAVGVYQFLALAAAVIFPGTVHQAIGANVSETAILDEMKRNGLAVSGIQEATLTKVITSLKNDRAKIAELGILFAPLVSADYGAPTHTLLQFNNLFDAVKPLEKAADLHSSVQDT